MLINLPRTVMLLPDFEYSGEKTEQMKELENWLSDLCRSLEEYFKKANYDISMGTSAFTTQTREPVLSDLVNGQMCMWNGHIYVRMNDAMYRCKLELVRSKELVCRVTVT